MIAPAVATLLLLVSIQPAFARRVGPQPSRNVPTRLLPDDLPPATAFVLNQCPHDVHIRACGLNGCSETTSLPANQVYTAPYPPPGAQGLALKVGTAAAPRAPALQFEVAQRDGSIWYDASAEDGNPFEGAGFVMGAADAACGRMECTAAMGGACESLYKPGEDDGRGGTSGYPLSCGAGAAAGLVLCTG